MSLRIVSATRTHEALFWRASYLGRSLLRIPETIRPAITIRYDNRGDNLLALGVVYNNAIDAGDDTDTLLLVHDDVYIHDWFVTARIEEALTRYDIIGLAGGRNPDYAHPSWGLHFDSDLRPDGWQEGQVRSGYVNHFDLLCPDISVYGPVPAQVDLLDGLFLAFRVSTIRQASIRFDESYRFHLYDLDFCRTATESGLTLGTWPIAVTHDSGGDYDDDEFLAAARAYLAKWSKA